MTDEEYDYNPQVLTILDTLRVVYGTEPHFIRWGQVDESNQTDPPSFIFRGVTRYNDPCTIAISKDRLRESENDPERLLTDIQHEAKSLNDDITSLEAERAKAVENDGD